MGGFSGFPSSRQYQIQLPSFYPGKEGEGEEGDGEGVSLSAADNVSVEEVEVPYVPLATSFSGYHGDCWTYDGRWLALTLSPSLQLNLSLPPHSSLSLLVNIVSSHSLTAPLTVNVFFASSASVDPFSSFPGFSGRAARFQAAKHTLDLQVWE